MKPLIFNLICVATVYIRMIVMSIIIMCLMYNNHYMCTKPQIYAQAKDIMYLIPSNVCTYVH